MKTLDERKKKLAIASDNLTAYWRGGKRDLKRYNKLRKLYTIASDNVTDHPDYEESLRRQTGGRALQAIRQAGGFLPAH